MFSELSSSEKDLTLRCLQSAAIGDLFLLSEAEYQIGMTVQDLERVVKAYPLIDDSRYDSHASLALDLCLANASRARRAAPLPLIPEPASEIDVIRMKIIGGK